MDTCHEYTKSDETIISHLTISLTNLCISIITFHVQRCMTIMRSISLVAYKLLHQNDVNTKPVLLNFQLVPFLILSHKSDFPPEFTMPVTNGIAAFGFAFTLFTCADVEMSCQLVSFCIGMLFINNPFIVVRHQWYMVMPRLIVDSAHPGLIRK